MEFRKTYTLRGPNIWANYPVVEAWLDLGALKESASDEMPGFNERLVNWLPSLLEHRCSVGERGGFFVRLRRGTYLAHILEHVVLELQSLAGTPTGFGRTRETAEDGVYKVAFEYDNEELAHACLEVSRQLCLAAVHDRPFDVATEVEQLKELARRTGPSAHLAALLQAARRRRLPVWRLDVPDRVDQHQNEALLQLGQGGRQRRLQGTITQGTSAIGRDIADDVELTRTLLRAAGVPVLEGRRVLDVEDACAAAEEIGFPVLVRPLPRRNGRIPFRNLCTREEVAAAYTRVAQQSSVFLERCAPGKEWRLLVVGDRVVTPTAMVHPEVIARAIDAARTVGLDAAGIDMVAEDLGRPLEGQGAVVDVVAGAPIAGSASGFSEEQTRQAADAILEILFPEEKEKARGRPGRVPLIAVTGVNGKTTTTRLIAHILERAGHVVGMACTDGVYVGGQCIDAGDCSGPLSAAMVLQNSRVEAAVLETARGGILRAGLGFDRCDVAVVTNIGEGDHLGLSDIDTPEKLANVKRTVVDVVFSQRKDGGANGTAVLKADDPLVASMAEHCPGDVLFFDLNPDHPILVQHRAAGGRVAFVSSSARERHTSNGRSVGSRQMLTLAEGENQTPLVALEQVPLTHGGRIAFQVENALMAAAATWALGVPCESIVQGLRSFAASMSQSPGRFNIFEIHGATVVVDYGHNGDSLAVMIQILKDLPHQHRVAVYSAPGDRRDEDILVQAKRLGSAFDRVIIFEDHYLRGRAQGEIIRLFRQGMSGGRVSQVEEICGAVAAMEHALATVSHGDLVLMQADVIRESVAVIERYLADQTAREISLEEAILVAQLPVMA